MYVLCFDLYVVDVIVLVINIALWLKLLLAGLKLIASVSPSVRVLGIVW